MALPVTGELLDVRLDAAVVHELDDAYAAYVLPESLRVHSEVTEALQHFGATHCLVQLPQPLERLSAILLDREMNRSRRVAAVMERTGQLDLWRYLLERCG